MCPSCHSKLSSIELRKYHFWIIFKIICMIFAAWNLQAPLAVIAWKRATFFVLCILPFCVPWKKVIDFRAMRMSKWWQSFSFLLVLSFWRCCFLKQTGQQECRTNGWEKMTNGWHQRQNFFGACKKTNGVKTQERAENTVNEMRDKEKWMRAEHFVKKWQIDWSSRESLPSITLLFLQFHLILSVIELFF